MATRTPTERTGRSSVVVERRGAASAIAHLSSSAPFHLRPLTPRGDVARIALSQSEATILAGDRIELDLRVGKGAALELVDVGALVVNHARGGEEASYESTIELEAGARLVWAGEPLIVSAGARLRRWTRVELATGAACLLAETVVLGRSGQEPGELDLRTRALLDGEPLLDDALRTGPDLTSPLVAGPETKVMTTLALLGLRDPEAMEHAGAMDLAGEGTLARYLRRSGAEASTAAAPLLSRWSGLLAA